ncbi:MAG TPA: ABC transporter permease [Candidatus Limnocylindria bacterium]|jgi:peptide/nickel transport system permease protein|nr:ABC transporter permease [Candidatus Limnocylindria bacterium]
MSRYLARRGLASLAILVGVSVLVFAAMRLVPGDPITIMLGTAELADPKFVDEFRRSYGLDQPIPVQYWAWLSHLLTGDFGRSVVSRELVGDLLLRRLSATLVLGSTAAVLALVVGILWGVAAAYVRGLFGGVLRSAPLFLMALPSFSIGIALGFIFAVWLRLLPSSGMQSPVDGGSVMDILRHTVLPAVTLAVYPSAFTARLTQASIDELQREDFVRTAQASGIPPGRITLLHVLPNALLPVMTNGGVMVGYMLTAAVFVEAVFAWPGVGTMMVAAVLNRDYPVVQAGALLVATTFVMLSWIIDVLYGLVDPRINVRGRPAQ